MQVNIGCFTSRHLGLRVWGLMVLMLTLTTSCCCQKKDRVTKPKVIEKAPTIPEPKVLPKKTPAKVKAVPERKVPPERKVTPKPQPIPGAPKGELTRTPYDSTAEDFVIPFSEMCIFSEHAMQEEEGEEKIDWGFITPWLYKE